MRGNRWRISMVMFIKTVQHDHAIKSAATGRGKTEKPAPSKMSPALDALMELQQYRTGYLGDRYWRLPYYQTRDTASIRRLLKVHDYPHSGSVSGFQPMLQRIARSLPAYEKCKIDELRRFGQQRGLLDADKVDRKQLIQALLHADDHPRFHLFLALPPELRTSVYRLYCTDFADEPLTLPTYPPRARANKQLRDEMLPVFYNECTFAVGLIACGRSASGGRSASDGVLRMQRDTALFFKSLSPESLAQIQRLEVKFDFRHVRQRDKTTILRVELPGRGNRGLAEARVHHVRGQCTGDGVPHPWSRKEIEREQLGELEERVANFVEGIRQRGQGENHLLIADVYRLRSMLETFFGED
jgi:hypothetical protein